MKPLSKPLSSPSRPDKFPPPLMRFLRTNVASKSRGRSRSSPIFYLRSRRSNRPVIEAAQEPSSPKVTCIGQVRVRRAGKSKVKKTAVKRRRWWWLRKAFSCGGISSSRRKKSFGRAFCEFFRFGYCKKIDVIDDEIGGNSMNREGETGGNGDEFRVRVENFGDGSGSGTSSSIPKNALILTRCRSAPYRSSSLGGIFWASGKQEEEEEDEQEQAVENGGKTEHLQMAENEERKRRVSEEIKIEKSVHPLILTRCKSTPARIGERLNADAIFSRLADVEQPPSQKNS